jgi:CRISPR-associated protein Cas2
LPPKGNIGIIRVTDKQFGDMEVYYGKEPKDKATPYMQLELF